MKTNLWISPISVVLIATLASTLAACVTINIYFPAAAANKAADKIIDDVWQLKSGEQPAKEPTAKEPKADEPVTPAPQPAPNAN